MIQKFNSFLKKHKKLSDFLLIFFDIGSKITHFFLFNFSAFGFLFLAFFVIPVSYSEEFINFFIQFVNNPSSFVSCFVNLPLAIKIVFLFYFFFTDLVFICTFLAAIPILKEKMIEKYNDPMILKKRGYNMLCSSLRRATALGIPLTAAVIVAGDTIQHQTTINAIIESNRLIFEEFRRTGDKKLFDHLQKIPSNRLTTKAHELSAGVKESIIRWTFGSKTKD